MEYIAPVHHLPPEWLICTAAPVWVLLVAIEAPHGIHGLNIT
jgi:hypothetical protein